MERNETSKDVEPANQQESGTTTTSTRVTRSRLPVRSQKTGASGKDSTKESGTSSGIASADTGTPEQQANEPSTSGLRRSTRKRKISDGEGATEQPAQQGRPGRIPRTSTRSSASSAASSAVSSRRASASRGSSPVSQPAPSASSKGKGKAVATKSSTEPAVASRSATASNDPASAATRKRKRSTDEGQPEKAAPSSSLPRPKRAAVKTDTASSAGKQRSAPPEKEMPKGKSKSRKMEEDDIQLDLKEDSATEAKKGKAAANSKGKTKEASKKSKPKSVGDSGDTASEPKATRKSKRTRASSDKLDANDEDADAASVAATAGSAHTDGPEASGAGGAASSDPKHSESENEDEGHDGGFAEAGARAGISVADLSAILGFGGMGMGGGAPSAGTFKDILAQLKQRADPTSQLVALQELAEILSVATEDMFVGHGGGSGSRMSGFNVDEFVKALIAIFQSPAGAPAEDFPIEFMDDFGDFGGGMAMNSELMLLACRCLYNLIEALPSSTLQIVHHGGVQVLVGKLMEVQYIDLAEQVLSVLEKISVDYSAAVVHANGLLAVLQYIEFFSLHVQRTAVTIAANASLGLGNVARGVVPGLPPSATESTEGDKVAQATAKVTSIVKEVIPLLQRLLLNSDQKLVEQTVICLSRIVDWCWKTESTLESLISTDLLETVAGLINPAGGNSATSNAFIFTKLVKMLANVAKGSATLGVELITKMGILDVVRNVLTGGVVYTNDDDDTNMENLTTAVMNVVVNRPPDQVLEVLGLASDVLPSLPKRGVWEMKPAIPVTDDPMAVDTPDTGRPPSPSKPLRSDSLTTLDDKDSRRLTALRSHKGSLTTFASTMIPLAIEVFGATVNAPIRRKIVEIVAKGVWYADNEQELSTALLRARGFGKFVSELVAVHEVAFGAGVGEREKREALLLVAACIQIASVVVDKCGPQFWEWFAREGVWAEVSKVIDVIAELDRKEGKGKPPLDPSASPSKSGSLAKSTSDLVKEFKRLRDQLHLLGGGGGSGSGSAASGERDSLMDMLEEAMRLSEGDDDEGGDQSKKSPTKNDSEDTKGGSEEEKAAEGSKPVDMKIDTTSLPEASGASSSSSAASTSTPGSVSSGLNVSSIRSMLERVTNRVVGSSSASAASNAPTIQGLNNERYTEEDVRKWLKATSEKLLEKYRQIATEGQKGNVLDELRLLAEALRGERVTLPFDEDDDTGLMLPVLRRIAEHFAGTKGVDGGAGITGFEILESGIMDGMSGYLTQPGKGDIVPPEAAGREKYATPLAARLRAFLHVFINGPTPDRKMRNHHVPNALRRLVQRLQESLSRTERFDVASAVPSSTSSFYDGSGSFYGSYGSLYGIPRGEASNPSLQLARTLKLKLVAEDPDNVPKAFAAVIVSVHAVATYKAIEDYLKPRVSEKKANASAADAGTSAGSTSAGGGTEETKEDTKAGAEQGAGSSSETAESAEKPTVDADGDVTMAEASESAPGEGESRVLEHDHDHDSGEDDDVGDYDDDDDDDMEEDQFANVGDLLLHSEEAQRRRRRAGSVGQGDAGSNPAASGSTNASGDTSARRDSVIDVRTDTPPSGSSAPTESGSAATASTPPALSAGASTTSPSKASPSKSYAAAAATSMNYSIEFSIGGQVVSRDSTIFGSVYKHEQTRNPGTVPQVWNRVHEVKYKKVEKQAEGEHQPSVANGANGRPESPERKKRVDSHLAVKLPFQTEMPSGISLDTAPGKILHLLRLLHGLNSRWAEVYTDYDADVMGASGEPSLLEGSQPAIRKAVTSTDIPISVSALPASMFANNKLTAKLNRQLDEPLIVAAHVLPDWCASLAREFSFLVPFETRLVYLQSTSFGYSRSMTRWQQQNQSGAGGGGAGSGRGGPNDPPVLGRTARQKVRIQRTRMIDSMMRVMELYGSAQALLEVEFFDEVGTGLGPTLEFYATVCKEVRKRKGVMVGGAGGVVERCKVWRDDDGVAGEKKKDVKGKGKAAKENGVDTVDTEEYLNPALGLFPAPISKEEATMDKGKRTLDLFKSLGTFVAKALLDSRIVDLPFSPIFLEMVVGEEEEEESAAEKALGPAGRKGAEFHLLRHVDPALYISLLDLKKFVHAKAAIEADTTLSATQRQAQLANIAVKGACVEDLCLDFTLPGYPHLELIPNGREANVTLDNVAEYVDRVVQFTVGDGVRRQVEAFRKGFDRVFPVTDLRSFSVQELAILVGGSEEEDWSYDTLIDAIKADHGYNSESRVIRNLAEMMSTFTPQLRRDFLQFVTGSPKLPIGGFKALTPPLTVVRKNVEGGRKPDEYLPSVMTCVNYLKVPEYSEGTVMKKRFEVAIAEGQGCFHLS
ncbi:Ubiquitin fusion degradation protein 4 [Borealophlyctis nickersoniae]|nr:Ubiquitin fusion degradation protein 4 [Borealophlyctis nickersoniae]